MTAWIVVTGAAGFIGCNLVRGLNQRGLTNILAVDDLTQGEKFRNLRGCAIGDYLDKEDFMEALLDGEFDGEVQVIFHQGACSDTMERNGKMMMDLNYHYSHALLDFAQEQDIPLIYASSAAVYGASTHFAESPENERPLNVYGYSKLLFDELVRQRLQTATCQIVGLRYFNVYGPHEHHKGPMASVALHAFEQLRQKGQVDLFVGSGPYGDGEQRRDFIYVQDVVAVNLHFLDHPKCSGVFNVGTGRASTFNDLAQGMINARRGLAGEPPLTLPLLQQQQLIRYVPFPGDLQSRYQNFTQSDVTRLQQAGFTGPFLDVRQGTARYVEFLADCDWPRT